MRTVRNSSRLLSGGSPHTQHWARHPSEQAPPQSRHPREQTPPGIRHPPGAGTPQSMHPLGAGTPAARHAGIPPAMHAGIATPPVNRITYMCKNITFATSLRTVNIRLLHAVYGFIFLQQLFILSDCGFPSKEKPPSNIVLIQ